MQEAKVYRVGAIGYIFAIMTVLFTLVGFGVLLPQTLREEPSELPFMLMWFGVLGWFWFNILNSPFEARVEPDGRIIFRSLRRRREVLASQILSVREIPLNGGITIVHQGGKIWLRAPTEHFFDFLMNLRELNPNVDTTRV